MGLAPIALFVFRRPDHTRRTIESLLANPEARESEIVVFADGPRSERDVESVAQTREVVRRAGLANLRLIARDKNMGLARSVIAGVTELCDTRGSVIVLEDDLMLARTFLRFMNDALERYRTSPSVYAVSGYMFPIDPPRGRDAFFLPFASSWGWATWSRAWRRLGSAAELHALIGRSRLSRRRFDLDDSYPYWAMLEALLQEKVDSWAIRWNGTLFRDGATSLYPARSLVRNTGFDGSGVNAGSGHLEAASAEACDFRVTHFPVTPEVDHEAYARVKRLLRRDRGLLRSIASAGAAALRRVLGRGTA